MNIHEESVVSSRDVHANQSMLWVNPHYCWYSLSLRNIILSSVITGRCREIAFKKVTGYYLKMLTWGMWGITARTVKPLSCEFLESRCCCLLLILLFQNLMWFLACIVWLVNTKWIHENISIKRVRKKGIIQGKDDKCLNYLIHCFLNCFLFLFSYFCTWLSLNIWN